MCMLTSPIICFNKLFSAIFDALRASKEVVLSSCIIKLIIQYTAILVYHCKCYMHTSDPDKVTMSSLSSSCMNIVLQPLPLAISALRHNFLIISTMYIGVFPGCLRKTSYSLIWIQLVFTHNYKQTTMQVCSLCFPKFMHKT